MPSALESKFLLLWRAAGRGIPLEREHRFDPERRWRFDFAHPASRVAVEVEGGTWVRGRHTRPQGFRADCEKYNRAAAEGWAVFRLTGELLSFAAVETIRDVIEKRTNDDE